MKITRAQKEISRLNGEISDIKHRLQNCITTIIGNDFTESFYELFDLYSDRLKKIIALKNAVHKINVTHDMHKNIVLLGELKHYLVFLKELDPKSGRQERHYSDTSEAYISQISIQGKNEAIQDTQQEINRITDLLDDFNAKTDIGETEVIVLNLPVIKKPS